MNAAGEQTHRGYTWDRASPITTRFGLPSKSPSNGQMVSAHS